MSAKRRKDLNEVLINGDFHRQIFSFPLEKDISSDDQYINSSIVIDNGSFRTRAGWSSELAPRLCFAPAIAKTKVKSRDLVLVGNQLNNKLPLSSNDISSPFTKNVVCDFSAMEHVLDYTFDNLANNPKMIENPILMTETLNNPSRPAMAELLFEYYQVPSINFAIDFLLSNFYNRFLISQTNLTKIDEYISNDFNDKNSLIISAGNDFTFVSPIKKGFCDFENTYRIPVGGKTNLIYLCEILKSKNQKMASHLTETTVFELMSKTCYCSLNFEEEILREKGKIDVKFCPSLTENDYFKKMENFFRADSSYLES
ncbi:Actin-related protein 5, partial [Bonamia ostreae]